MRPASCHSLDCTVSVSRARRSDCGFVLFRNKTGVIMPWDTYAGEAPAEVPDCGQMGSANLNLGIGLCPTKHRLDSNDSSISRAHSLLPTV